MIDGIDVSKWEDDNSTPQHVDFNKAYAAGARFVGIKASQATWLDPDFTINWVNAKLAGVMRTACHYMDWTTSALNQARFFCGVISHDPGELPPTFDYECRTGAPTTGTARTWAKTFLEEVFKITGRRCIIYTGPSFWAEFGSQDSYWAQYPLWIANYGVASPTVPKPWTKWHIWQDKPNADGPTYGCESKGVDHDFWQGDLASLAAFGGLLQPPVPPAPVPVPVPAPAPVDILYKAVTTAALNMRSLPGGPLLATLQPMITVEVIAENDQHTWCKINLHGWVSKSYLRKI